MHATIARVAIVAIVGTLAPAARAQDIGFGLADAYRYYADPGNGGGSAYAPFFDPYRGNRIVRGAYPDALYDGRGFHYGKAVPPSLDAGPSPYDAAPSLPLRVGETETAPLERLSGDGRGAIAGAGRRHPVCRGRRLARHRGPARACLGSVR